MKDTTKLDLNREGHKTWRLLNNLEGKSIKTNLQPLIQDGKEIVCDKRKTEEFTLQMSTNKKEETCLTAIYGEQLNKTTLPRDINMWHLKHHLIWQN